MGSVVLPPQALNYLPYPTPQRRHSNTQQAFPQSTYSFPVAPDFNTDSGASPDSPTLPVFGDRLPPGADEWLWDDRVLLSPQFANFPDYDGERPSFLPQRNLSVSPAINPMDLTNRPMDDVSFSSDGLNNAAPLFQPSQPTPTPVENQTRPRQGRRRRRPSGPAALSPSASDSSTLSSGPQSPESHNTPSRKRKSPSESGDDVDSARDLSMPSSRLSRRRSVVVASTTTKGAPKKSAHNMVEKRYRNNLNDRIIALRDSVPSLRVMAHRLEADSAGQRRGQQHGRTGNAGVDDDGDEDLGGLAPAQKLNKATILNKAAEYIAYLERQNRKLAREIAAMQAHPKLLTTGKGNGIWA